MSAQEARYLPTTSRMSDQNDVFQFQFLDQIVEIISVSVYVITMQWLTGLTVTATIMRYSTKSKVSSAPVSPPPVTKNVLYLL
jgi:hypothetical protein